MGLPFDLAPDRPESIDAILNGLDRYNPETTTVFQEYVQQQCENQTYDCYANLALLKLYQFNPHLTQLETTTNILVKSLTVFPSPDFSLGLSLLPPNVLASINNTPQSGSLAEAVQHLHTLHDHLINSRYAEFWNTLDGDDLYADLVADVQGFEEVMRIRIAVVVSQCMQAVDRHILEGWLNLSGAKFDHFIKDVCDWKFEANGGKVLVPLNKDNEAKGQIVRENVKFEQFGQVVKRAFKEPA